MKLGLGFRRSSFSGEQRDTARERERRRRAESERSDEASSLSTQGSGSDRERGGVLGSDPQGRYSLRRKTAEKVFLPGPWNFVDKCNQVLSPK